MQITGKLLEAKPAWSANSLYLSVSKVKTFKDCKAKFKFSYIDKLPKKDWEHLIFGKFMHAILEHFILSIINGYTGPDDVLIKKCYEEQLKEYKITPEVKEESLILLDQYLDLRRLQISKNELPNPLAVEKEFNVNIEQTILLNGLIDLIQTDPDGMLHVADYKTTKDKKYLKKDFFQLKTYAYVMFLANPELERVRCSYILLRHKFESIKIEFTRAEAMEVEDYLIQRAAEIRSERIYRATTTPLCGYCDFLNKCKAGMTYMDRKKAKENSVSFGETDW